MATPRCPTATAASFSGTGFANCRPTTTVFGTISARRAGHAGQDPAQAGVAGAVRRQPAVDVAVSRCARLVAADMGTHFGRYRLLGVSWGRAAWTGLPRLRHRDDREVALKVLPRDSRETTSFSNDSAARRASRGLMTRTSCRSTATARSMVGSMWTWRLIQGRDLSTLIAENVAG